LKLTRKSTSPWATPAGNATKILAVEDAAWRNMFRSSIWLAMKFFIVAMCVNESPRRLFRRGRTETALTVLLKGRDQTQAELEMREMEEATGAAQERRRAGGDPLSQRHYIVRLVLAVVLLGINQATGIVAVFTFPVVMLHQSGLSETAASHTGVWLALTNFTVTIFGVLLVDRLGRNALLKIGTSIIIVALTVGVFTFLKVESSRQDVSAKLQRAVIGNTLNIPVKDIVPSSAGNVQVNVVYAYDGNEQMTLVRSDAAEPVLSLKPDAKSPAAALKIVRAKFSAAPSEQTGQIIFACLLLYIVGFAFGPGVCRWLMSAELLPTRVRSLGMGLGVLFNALVTIGTTAMFLPVVGNFGYAAMWAIWLGCTVAYFLFAALVLPETKGKTLEEIEARLARKKTVG
jgi:MFS transporter, SP family, solute carrier family 2 (myo-inositol transporter), member 13